MQHVPRQPKRIACHLTDVHMHPKSGSTFCDRASAMSRGHFRPGAGGIFTRLFRMLTGGEDGSPVLRFHQRENICSSRSERPEGIFTGAARSLHHSGQRKEKNCFQRSKTNCCLQMYSGAAMKRSVNIFWRTTGNPWFSGQRSSSSSGSSV